MSKRRIITMVKKMADENMKVAIDKDEFVNYSLDLVGQTREQDAKIFFTAYMTALRNEFGFGEKRLRKLHSRGVELAEEYMKDPATWRKAADELIGIGLKINDIKGENKNV